MAIVGLQLAAESMLAAVTGNVRALNQGDVSVESASVSISPSDLSFFDQLKSQGTISAYSPEETGYSLAQVGGGSTKFLQDTASSILHPRSRSWPPPRVTRPAGASLRTLLSQPRSLRCSARAWRARCN